MSSKDEKPYLSIVVTARNDIHGEKFLERMQIFVSGILEQLTKYDLSSELIIVEWNPPSDRPRLSEAISWTHKDGPCKIRIIEVPPEIHNRLDYSDKIFLHQMIGKNVGIRRARGEFVIATNVDILFSDELTEFFSSKSLKQKFFYRVDRYDVSDILYPAPLYKQLDHCKHSITKIFSKDGDFIPDTTANKEKKSWYSFLRRRKPVYAKQVDAKQYHRQREQYEFKQYPYLHTNACGDFTLMAREKWHELRGYAELALYPVHIDGLILQMAYQDGLREKILEDPMRIYHMVHAGGYNPENPEKVFQRCKESGIPWFTFDRYQKLSEDMNKKKLPIITNKESWGFGSDTLTEKCIN